MSENKGYEMEDKTNQTHIDVKQEQEQEDQSKHDNLDIFFTDEIDKAIKNGDVDKIKKLVTPLGLADCSPNILEKSLKVSYKLKNLPDGPNQTDLESLGDTVEHFAKYLLKYSKKDKNTNKKDFDKCINRIIHVAICYNAKTFLSSPMTQNFLSRLWTTRCFQLKNTSPGWVLRNLWTLLDVVLFPVVFFLLFIYQQLNKACCTKRPERYKRYFQMPYFVFLRDSLSYLALLLLHCAVCVQPTGLRFSVLEWIIMVFFIGRIFMEIDQAIVERSNENEFTCERSNYFHDFWNKLDMAIIAIYATIVIFRVVTWSSTYFISHNLLLITASYLYGINAMLLTLRVFGQGMEIQQSTGTKQIALLRIIGAVAVIFVQMVAAILGFSLILTKIYVAEISYNAMTNVSSHGWWHMFEFLAWSTMGSVDADLLTLTNDVSNYITKVLYMVFLVITAIMIMNMLIALLSNTYQQVEDNAFHEWAYRKAYIIKTYCNYHPIPVPFNILTLPWKLISQCYSIDRQKQESNDKTVNWHCSGVTAEGQRLSHVKCKNCVKTNCVHGARYETSLSKECPGFEVFVQKSGKLRVFGVGVASKNYKLWQFPGWDKESVGYHADIGAIFDMEHRDGKVGDDTLVYRGDLIGCVVLFDNEKDNVLPVQFTRNGRVVGVAKIDAQLIGNLHPFVAMAYPGIKLLFRVCNNLANTNNCSHYL
ncbi:hypothetical protein QZH41_019566 [Actinostola sp. cb2023]|nr:hypothetical protein QZH41_019566 [Actinostola sp. cb2023]